MLYDPKWEKRESRIDVLKVELLIGWLETQPPDATYNYLLSDYCVVAQFLRANGVDDADCSIGRFDELGLDAWDQIAQGDGSEGEWTFGAALRRARKIAA